MEAELILQRGRTGRRRTGHRGGSHALWLMFVEGGGGSKVPLGLEEAQELGAGVEVRLRAFGGEIKMV